MNGYEEKIARELQEWQKKMMRKPSLTGRLAKGWQNKVNNFIPDQVHELFTIAVKNMVKAVLLGSEYMTKGQAPEALSLEERETLVREKINFYQKAAMAEGAGTGAGGILLGLADFPLLLSIKMKFLFDVAGLYRFDVKDLRERLYILTIFQLAFSSPQRRRKVYQHILNWDQEANKLPASLETIDWRLFQQEYRDYIDLAKMLQLVPGIGAFVGAYANYRLLHKLGETAMNCYRMRLLSQ